MSQEQVNAIFDEPAAESESRPQDTSARERIDALIDAKPVKDPDPSPPATQDKTPAADPEPTKTKDEPAETLGLSDDTFDEEIGDDEQPDNEGESLGEAEAETLDAKSLAEKLGIDVKDLYEMEFPYGENGEAITLGELKDAGIRARTIDEEAETLTNDRNSYVNEQMKSRNELQQIVSLLPDIPPGLRDAAIRQHDVVRQTERVKMLETVPEWRDPGKEQEAMNNISSTLKEYGYSDTEMSYMLDHRMIKLFHDFTRLKGKLVKPKAAIQAVKKKSGSRRKNPDRGKNKRDTAAAIGSKGNVKGAIDKLFE